jgi:hypothetical protein
MLCATLLPFSVYHTSAPLSSLSHIQTRS